MPGGVESQDETILEAVNFVDSESPTYEALVSWILEQGEMTSEESAERRISFLKQADLLSQNVEQMRVGSNGYQLLDAGDKQQALYTILDDEYLGISTLLKLVDDYDTKEQLHQALIENLDQDVDWRELHQTNHRLNYLRSIGYVDLHEDDTYAPTPAGRARLSETDTPDSQYSEPPTPTELMSSIRDDSGTTPDFYWVNHDNTGHSSTNYIRPRLDTDTGVSPRDIGPSDIIFRYEDGEVIGYSTLREPGTITTESGTEYYRTPVFFREFSASVPLSSVIGALTSSEHLSEAVLEDPSYPFTETGLRNISLGVLPSGAAKTIFEMGGELDRYADVDVELELSASQLPEKDDFDLHFPEEPFDAMMEEIEEALLNDQHLILIGPPGSGKTKLAQTIAGEVNNRDGYALVTATADWSTFDTVGGYQPDREAQLDFIPGVFLSRFQRSDAAPANEWLIVDEINRANIDKAFGSFFSALSGDDVTTAFKSSDGNEIEILGSGDADQIIRPSRYYIPKTWRLIATMNTHDKMSLYDMSYAFMRRFAFIHVGAPDAGEISTDLIKEYVSEWSQLSVSEKGSGDAENEYGEEQGLVIHEDGLDDIASFWETLQPHRTIGPAIIRNLSLALARQGPDTADLTGPLKMYVLPQLEDLPENTQIDAINALLNNDEIPLARERFRRFASDYFGIDRERFTTG
ncbi:AAA family ATPase [Natronomonas marina]|uniref:AAA family ATPase n=1 Tax=Natronomonas marina TaxID=2961939 RepID=UPI0020C9CB41|nr:AAA family ATPase [Natronomonas marina]